jgi:hypothetical protein
VCSLMCISRALPRHLRGFDLLGAKSGATAGETAQFSGRRDRNAAESKGVTARRDWHELGQSVRVLPHTKR